MNTRAHAWRWFFGLAALEAGAAFVALLLIPRESGGFSGARLAILALIGGCFLAGGYLAARPRSVSARFENSVFPLISTLAALALAAGLFLLRYWEPQRLLPYYERLSPFLWYLLLLCLEFSGFWLWISRGLNLRVFAREGVGWRAGALAFGALLAVFILVVLTRIGLTPDSAYWGEPGVPILGWQLAIAALCGAVVLFLGLRMGKIGRFDLIASACIWLLATGLWLSVPTDAVKNSFYAPINPPAFQPFPNSDAGYYDSMAESLFIGYPYQGVIPTRPLYIVMVTLLHLVAGDRYDAILAGQSMLLAMIPVVLYLLGTRLHSRAAGIVIALCAIFREWNSLLISSQTRVSNTRMLLVDLPTLLLMLVACFFVVRWLERRNPRDALIAGGSMGLLLLLRTQSLLLQPAILMLAVLAYGLRKPGWKVPVLLFVVGVLVSTAPWLIHNYLQSGMLTLDAQFQYQVLASQYKYSGNLDLGSIDLQGKSLLGILLTFALKDPGFVAGFISSHFLATLIDSLLVLPLAAPYDGLFAPINLYWIDWLGNLSAANIAILLAYLAIISVGVGAAWRRLPWAGVAPLVFAVSYALTNGIGRFSGWRYDLPADWVGYFYFGIGIVQVVQVVASGFGAAPPSSFPEGAASRNLSGSLRWAALLPAAAVFALVGSLPWFAEGMARPRYAEQTMPILMEKLQSSHAVQLLQVDDSQLQAFAAQPQATLQIGRVLYPRYFTRGDGLASAHPWPAYAVRDFPRLGFLLLNQDRRDAVIPLRQLPVEFPQAADAIVLGCLHKDYLEVRLLLFPGIDVAYLGGPLGEPCQ